VSVLASVVLVLALFPAAVVVGQCVRGRRPIEEFMVAAAVLTWAAHAAGRNAMPPWFAIAVGILFGALAVSGVLYLIWVREPGRWIAVGMTLASAAGVASTLGAF
jgi:hypothetical protein